MASYVNKFTVGPDWVKVADAKTNVGIQFAAQGRIRINIADEDPDDDTPGVLIDKTALGESNTFSLSNLPLGANVYAQAEMGEDDTQIIVVAY